MSLTAIEVIQQAFSPAVAVIASSDVNNICGKNRLTFVELLQPFSRLTVEGQIRDPNNSVHTVSQLRLSVRDVKWKPHTTPVAKRMLAQSVSLYNSTDSKNVVTRDSYQINVYTQTPWFDAWRETFWGCMELGDHDFTRHYLACLIVVASSEENPMEKLSSLSNQLQLNMSNGTNGPEAARWFGAHVLRYYILVHDACEGNSAKAEETYQMMRTTYGTHACHYLVINSKSVQNGDTADSIFPAPDPWYRFLPKKLSKAELSEDEGSVKGSFDGSETSLQELPSLVVEGDGMQSHKLPFVEALQDAMKEISNSVLSPSASTVALSQLSNVDKNNTTSYPEVEDPLTSGTRTEVIEDHQSYLTNFSSDKTSPLETHGACLTTDDVDRIQHLVNEFCLRALLPHVERQIKLLHESALARKSTHRSLLNATKRWFGTGKTGVTSQAFGSNAAPFVSYHPESTQLQLRRLGDLSFLIGHYELAYWAYHTVKKEFEADQAWLHFASALEMAGYSAFMSGIKRPVPYHYYEKALTTFLHTCKMSTYATRCAVLSSECYRACGMYSDAALQLIRLTSEDSDLRSALFLEQAALCFLRSAMKAPLSTDVASPTTVPLLRKFALNMILAGHRFGKAGQRKHASRAYQQALQVYEGRHWNLAEDHIHYTIGRQFLSGQQLDLACQALTNLFKMDSQQSAAQQAIFLKEFVNVYQLLASQQGKSYCVPVFPLPSVDGNKIKVLTDVPEPISNIPSDTVEASHVSFRDEEAHNNKWREYEERLIQAAQGSIPMTFRPTNVLFTETTNNTVQPFVYTSELVSLEVPVHNPLHIPLTLVNLKLLWTFKTEEMEVSNSSLNDRGHESYVTTYVISRLVLEPTSTNKVVLHLRPLSSGELHVNGLGFELNGNNANSTIPCQTAGKVLFSVRGPRLNSTLMEKSGKFYGVDRRLNLVVLPAVPKLRVLLKKLREFLLSGQVEHVEVQAENVHHQSAMGNVYVAVSDPINAVLDLPRVPLAKQGSTDPVIYKWDTSFPSTTFWVRGCDQVGLSELDLMFYYEIPGKLNSYRLLRHSCKIFISPSLALRGWSERIPFAKDDIENTEDSLACYLELKNQREEGDCTLSGIKINQVSLVSENWVLQSWHDENEGTRIPRELRAQQSLVYTLRSLRCRNEPGNRDTVRNNRLFHESSNHSLPFLELLSAKTAGLGEGSCTLKSAVHWEALQTSEDGSVQNLIKGLSVVFFPSLKTSSKEKPQLDSLMAESIINYSLDYNIKTVHNFKQQKVCVVPVSLIMVNTTDRKAVITFVANSDTENNSQKTQLYMPEPASPLKWIGQTKGKIILEPKALKRIQLHVAALRPGTFSLAHGIQLFGSFADEETQTEPVLQNMRLEFTLFIEPSV